MYPVTLKEESAYKRGVARPENMLLNLREIGRKALSCSIFIMAIVDIYSIIFISFTRT